MAKKFFRSLTITIEMFGRYDIFAYLCKDFFKQNLTNITQAHGTAES